MRTLTLAFVLVICHSALAKPRQPQSSPPSPPPQRFDFGDEVIETSTDGPLGGQVDARRHPSSPSLLHVRQNFLPEMLRSADAI